MSEGDYYDTTSYSEYGFSGGPVLGTWESMIPSLDLILLDSHGARLGLLLSDAGKREEIGSTESFAAEAGTITTTNRSHSSFGLFVEIYRRIDAEFENFEKPENVTESFKPHFNWRMPNSQSKMPFQLDH